MVKQIYEIFEEVEKAPTLQDRAAILHYNDTQALHMVLRGAFHPGIRYLIKKIPLYKPSDSPRGMGYTSIYKELGRIYLFEEGHPRRPAGLTNARMNTILIQMLEAMEAKEAIVFSNMLLKNLRVKNLNEDAIKLAYPHKWHDILG